MTQWVLHITTSEQSKNPQATHLECHDKRVPRVMRERWRWFYTEFIEHLQERSEEVN